MTRKSAEKRKEEKQAVDDIIAQQDQDVIKMYNDIAYIRNTMRHVGPEVQATEDSIEKWFETAYPSGGVRASAKGRHHIYQAVKTLRARFNATQHDMDRFEEVLKNEWAVEQNKIWQERDEYLKVKVKEMNKYCRKFSKDVKKHLTDAGIHIPTFADDEVSDDNGDTADEDEDEEEEGDESGSATGEEDGDDAALTDDEDSEDKSAAKGESKGKAAAPPAPTVEDENEDESSTKDDTEEAKTEGKGKAAKKKDKKKKKPNRNSKKGKRR